MKAKFIILIGIVLFMAMPKNVKAQQETEYQTERIDTTEAFSKARSAMKKHKEWLENRKIEEVFPFTGKIIQWHVNVEFIYDGFYLLTEDDIYLVRFERTLGAKIRSIGDDVSLNASIVKHSGDIKVLNLVNIKGKGDIVHSNGAYNYLFHSSNPDDFRSGKSKIKEYVYSDKNNIIGYVLENNVVLRMQDFATKQLSDMIQIGATVEYTGIETKIKEGEVAAENYKAIHCQTITVNGKQYLVI